MSTSEYYDMFIEGQNKGKYHMFVFDIEGSKKMDKKTRQTVTLQMEELMYKIYNEIRQIEKLTKTKILVIDVDGIVSYTERTRVSKKFGMLFEPFLFADTFGFTVYRNSISKNEIISIYQKNKQELNITFNFHVSDGFYETNKYEEGSDLLFRGYCMDILSNYHKDYNKKIRKRKMYNS